MFTAIARWWFRTPIHDVYCGMRAFSRDMWLTLDQRCTGMEFALEMVIKASLFRANTAEMPITLHPGWAQGASAASEDVSRRLAQSALLSALQPALAVPDAGTRADSALGIAGYALAMPRLRIGA